MKHFLKNIGVFLAIILGSMLFVFSLADGTSDPFYFKFVKPKQHSLVIGTSRAAIGIQPKIINETSQRINDQNELFNYAFTLIHSPYGKTYLESIESKLKSSSKKGIHIITVCPWSISSKTKNPEDSLHFREVNRTLSKVKNTSQSFNVQYLFDAYEKQYVNIPLLQIIEPKMKVCDDGWLEMNLPMDDSSLKKRHQKILNVYKNEYCSIYQFSKNRYDYLKKTINLLKKHGEVYVIRLPVHQDFLNLENQFFPEFNSRMNDLSEKMRLNYFDMTPLSEWYGYIDGNHLDNESAVKVSKEISMWIDNVDLQANIEQ